jgi:hypothetical protein
LFKDRLASIFGSPAAAPAPAAARPGPAASAGGPVAPEPSPPVGEPGARRHSPGLEQFLSMIRVETPLSILDLAGANQANVSYITGMGHRVYSDDIVRALDSAFGDGDFFANQSDPARVAAFMSQTLDFPECDFGGAIVWDALQYLSAPLLQQTVDQLYHVLQPGAPLLALFHADEKRAAIPVYSYRIVDSRTVLLISRETGRPAQFFTNRNIEKLFERYRSVKFFLIRDNLREVLVVR